MLEGSIAPFWSTKCEILSVMQLIGVHTTFLTLSRVYIRGSPEEVLIAVIFGILLGHLLGHLLGFNLKSTSIQYILCLMQWLTGKALDLCSGTQGFESQVVPTVFPIPTLVKTLVKTLVTQRKSEPTTTQREP